MVPRLARTVAALLLAAASAHGAGGALDPSFGGDGVVSVDVGSQNPNVGGRAVLVQPDRKIVVVGTGGPGPDFTFVRLHPGGAPDHSFGGTGVVTVPFGGPSLSRAVAGVLQPDGRIVGAGIGPGLLQQGFAVARVMPDGTPDPSFDGDGRAEASFGTRVAGGNAVALQSDGKIVVGGRLDDEAPQFSYDFALVRFTADGALDPTFGDGGLVVTDLAGAADGIEAIGIDSQGRIVAAGFMSAAASQPGVALARYLPDGTLDASFGTGGLVLPTTAATRATALLVLPDDSMIVGAGEFAWTLRRFHADGSLDVAFGDGGVASTYLPWESPSGQLLPLAAFPHVILREPDGHLVVAGGYIAAGGPLALARYDASGVVDLAFGYRGVAVVQDGPGARPARGAALQSDGAIVTVGDQDFGLVDHLGIVVTRHVADSLCGPSGEELSRARLRLGMIDAVEGNDTLTLRASAAFGVPVTPRPDVTGLRIVVEDAGGGIVLDKTVPAGVWNPDTRSGWRSKSGGSSWRYDAPEVGGRFSVKKATLRATHEPGHAAVTLKTSRGELARAGHPLPWSLSVVIDGTADQCATASFAPQRCAATRAGAIVSCK